MRERPRADLQRNEIARYAGVTPALISYYFPDRSHLFEAAAHPVIEIYVAEARLIIGSDQPLIHRLNALILLFVEFNYKEGHLLDFYLEHMSRTGCKNDIVMLEGINKDLLIFFDDLIQTRTIRGENAGVIQSMLWGMCKHSAKRSDLIPGASAVEIEDFIRLKATVLSDYFLHGAIGSPSRRSLNATEA